MCACAWSGRVLSGAWWMAFRNAWRSHRLPRFWLGRAPQLSAECTCLRRSSGTEEAPAGRNGETAPVGATACTRASQTRACKDRGRVAELAGGRGHAWRRTSAPRRPPRVAWKGGGNERTLLWGVGQAPFSGTRWGTLSPSILHEAQCSSTVLHGIAAPSHFTPPPWGRRYHGAPHVRQAKHPPRAPRLAPSPARLHACVVGVCASADMRTRLFTLLVAYRFFCP